MGTDARKSAAHVIGPDGQSLTLADLPHPTTSRWVMKRKADVVAAVEGGLLSLVDACVRYRLTPEEFMEWEECLRRYGLSGLKATHAQAHRHSRPRIRTLGI